MRIVLPYAASFSLEALHCLDPARQAGLPRRHLGEISRVCVIRSPTPHARNPHLNWEFGHVNPDRESEIVLGLIRTLIIYGLDRGIEHSWWIEQDRDKALKIIKLIKDVQRDSFSWNRQTGAIETRTGQLLVKTD